MTRYAGFCLALLATCGPLSAQTAAGPVLTALDSELKRSFDELKKQRMPPYYLSYEATETHSVNVAGSFGTLTFSNETKHRQLDIDMRVGDYALDNTRQVRGAMPMFADRYSSTPLPIDDDTEAIRAAIWYHTDQKYKRAIEQLRTVRMNNAVKVETEDKAGDFSRAPAETYTEDIGIRQVDRKAWEQKVRTYTAPFRRYGIVYEANASLSANTETRWFVSSDGSRIQTSQTYYRLFMYAFTKASDGMELPRYESWFSFTPEGLPDDATVLKAADKIISDLKALKMAPVVDPYTGPAILSGRATGVFFHEVFGHRIEGHRQKLENESQTYRKMIGEKVLPDFISVYFDPTLRNSAGKDLVGFYRYDNEGVKARRVTAVENGVLKSFLMSRTPIDDFPESNGHGRRQPGFAPVARQSNLIVASSEKPLTHARLKAKLIEQVKAQGKPFGLFFDDIEGGFTMTGRTIPNAFNVLPVMVYRIYPDGREELVRGVDLIGTPLTVFTKILAVDDDVAVFNGICGAESGAVPVSASGPGILISQIEVQKKTKSQERSPILGPPFDDR